MEGMFSYCGNLQQLDLSSFDTSAVTECMNYMFQDCSNLETIYVTTAFTTVNASETNDMFDGCSTKLTGGMGTTWASGNPKDKTYARIDDPTNSRPGYFSKVQIGQKSAPSAVGDIVFSDGSATPYSADLTLSNIQKKTAIAIIFYAGASFEDLLGQRTLGIGIKNGTSLAWADSNADGFEIIEDIVCTPDRSGTNGAGLATYFEGVPDGSNNWSLLCDFVTDEDTTGNYPAWEWVNNYANLTGSNIAGTNYASGWYMPTVAEFCLIYRNLTTINDAVSAITGSTLSSGYYWTSSQINDSSYANNAYQVHSTSGLIYMQSAKSSTAYVCAIRRFN